MKSQIRVVHIDDETHVLETFKYLLATHFEDVNLIKSYSKPDRFLNDWKAGFDDFDLLFLDVEMNPFNGIELISQMKTFKSELDFDVIFLTAYDDFALDAFRYNAIDYLLKPLMPEDLEKSFLNWKSKINRHIDPRHIELLKQFYEQPGKKMSQLAVPTFEGYEIIPIEKIIRCQAERNYTKILLHQTKPPELLVSKNLKGLEIVLIKHGFLRIHHSHLINPIFIKRILKTDGGMLELCDGSKIKITKNKAFILENLFNTISKI